MYYYKEVKKPNRLFGKALLFLCRKYLHHKVDIYVEENDTKKLKPPYLILGNHVTYWDPFLVNMFIDEPMCYIAAAVYFRNPILRFFLNSAGSIPKKKFMTHYSPIKRLIQAKENGRILGIFPEGERKWDGTTDEMTFQSTAKLIKKLDIPVVTVKIKGGYLAYPRWARLSRRGKVNLDYKLSLTREDSQNLSIEQIEDRIREHLSHDDFAYQKKNRNQYVGKNLAENLEHLLFLCPHCHSFNTLSSQGNILLCNKCNYGVVYNQFAFLESLQEKLYFDNLRDWNRWQNRYLKEFIFEKFKKQNNDLILKDKAVDILEGSFHKPFTYIGNGDLCLGQKGLFFYILNGEKYEFELRKITGLNVQFQAVLEFNYQENIYRFQFQNQHISAYKWVQAVHCAREEVSVI
jgi:1-acyl-sn-glycerol-3-phosphate acyltransferase